MRFDNETISAARHGLNPVFSAPFAFERVAQRRDLNGKRKPVATVDACVFRQP